MKQCEISTETQELVYYSIFKEKKEDLESFIQKELDVWGEYESIPAYIRKIIDREFIALGKYGKRINIHQIEERLTEDSLQLILQK